MKINGRELTTDEISQERSQYGRVRSFEEVQRAERTQESRRIGMMLKSHPDGKLLVETLRDLFYDGDMLGETPEKTYFNLGQRNVVAFLLDLQKET